MYHHPQHQAFPTLQPNKMSLGKPRQDTPRPILWSQDRCDKTEPRPRRGAGEEYGSEPGHGSKPRKLCVIGKYSDVCLDRAQGNTPWGRRTDCVLLAWKEVLC